MRIRRGDQRETDARHASRGNAEPASHRAREIDDPTLHMRTAVVDSNLHGTGGLEIGDEARLLPAFRVRFGEEPRQSSSQAALGLKQKSRGPRW